MIFIQGTRRRPASVIMEVLRLVAVLGIALGLGSCAPTESDFLVSGKVSRADTGTGLAGVGIAFSGSIPAVATVPGGTWSQTDLRGVVIVTPEKSGWHFEPPSRTVSDQDLSVDFAAVKSEASILVTLNIAPPTATVQHYAKLRLMASGTDQYGDAIDVNPTWAVVGRGMVWPLTGVSVEFTALGVGTVEIRAAEGAVVASAMLEVVPEPVPGPSPGPCVRIGAICNDGWRSDATGSGACSHHGGVAYWLCARSQSVPLLRPVTATSP